MQTSVVQDQLALWGPATLVAALFCVAYFRRTKKTVPIIPKDVLAERLCLFRPEPMINQCDSHIDEEDLDREQPDESDPDCLNLAKVNYLNMLDREDIRNVAEKCIRSNGVGSCGPRGFYGTIDIHLDLESKIADFMGMEETVLYSYGFSTVASAIGAYCKRSDILFCDDKISFAAKQGIVAAKSKTVYFKHNDMEDLENKLKEYEQLEAIKKKLFRKFLIVEGIYASTGTICNLPKLMELREKYKLRIFLDESLSFGVLGKHGRGVTEHFNIDRSDVDMIIGSLEGSIGSIGGFCVGASIVIEHQRLSGLGYCFSASLPPFLSKISIYTLELFEKNPELFEKLRNISIQMDKHLRALEFYQVLSDPLSPLKVLTVTGDVDKIHNYCIQKKLYLVCWESNLYLNVNMSMSGEEIVKITSILKEANHGAHM